MPHTNSIRGNTQGPSCVRFPSCPWVTTVFIIGPVAWLMLPVPRLSAAEPGDGGLAVVSPEPVVTPAPRVRVPDEEGIFLVQDAPKAEKRAGGRRVYLAWWRDYAGGGVYIYGRRLYALPDVGHALFALERDLGIDIGLIASKHQPLEAALDAAVQEPEDETGWLLATRGTVYALMGLRLRPGDDDENSLIFTQSLDPCYPVAATGPTGDGNDEGD